MQKLPSKDTAPTLGERWADKVAEFGGSWTFIILFMDYDDCVDWVKFMGAFFSTI